jgi:hypothetical protein
LVLLVLQDSCLHGACCKLSPRQWCLMRLASRASPHWFRYEILTKMQRMQRATATCVRTTQFCRFLSSYFGQCTLLEKITRCTVYRMRVAAQPCYSGAVVECCRPSRGPLWVTESMASRAGTGGLFGNDPTRACSCSHHAAKVKFESACCLPAPAKFARRLRLTSGVLLVVCRSTNLVCSPASSTNLVCSPALSTNLVCSPVSSTNLLCSRAPSTISSAGAARTLPQSRWRRSTTCQ